MSWSCDIQDQDPADLQRVTYPKARKQHRCCECGLMIEPSHVYQLIETLEDGKWYREKTCEPCADLRESLEEAGWCADIGCLKECYLDYLDETVPYDEAKDSNVYPRNHLTRKCYE